MLLSNADIQECSTLRTIQMVQAGAGQGTGSVETRLSGSSEDSPPYEPRQFNVTYGGIQAPMVLPVTNLGQKQHSAFPPTSTVEALMMHCAMENSILN